MNEHEEEIHIDSNEEGASIYRVLWDRRPRVNFSGYRPSMSTIVPLLSFIVGVVFGLTVLGWWLFPVSWEGSDFGTLDPVYQNELVLIMSDHFAWSQNSEYANLILGNWNADVIACQLSRESVDLAERARLLALAYTLNGVGCHPETGTYDPS